MTFMGINAWGASQSDKTRDSTEIWRPCKHRQYAMAYYTSGVVMHKTMI